MCVCVCVTGKAAVFLVENSKAYDHFDETPCSNLKLPLKQGVLHITCSFPFLSTECSI